MVQGLPLCGWRCQASCCLLESGPRCLPRQPAGLQRPGSCPRASPSIPAHQGPRGVQGSGRLVSRSHSPTVIDVTQSQHTSGLTGLNLAQCHIARQAEVPRKV